MKKAEILRFIAMSLVFINIAISCIFIFYDNNTADIWFGNTGIFVRTIIIAVAEIYLFYIYKNSLFVDSLTVISMLLGLIFIIFTLLMIISIGIFKF